MKIEQMKIKDIIPYERNAKKHDNNQINNVAESIQRFGFAQPLVVDKDNVLIIGHCRLLAAKRLKLREVPVVKMTELTEDQVKQLRLLDNKLNESEWDLDLLMSEIEGLDFEGFNIDWEIPELEETLEVIEDEAPEPELEKEPITKPGTENTTIICSREVADFYKDFFDGINPFNKGFEDWKKAVIE